MSNKHTTWSIGREAARDYGKTKWWENKTPQEIIQFQLFVAELCMPLTEFHKNLELCLGKTIFASEMTWNYDAIVDEFLGGKEAPTFQEIVNMIPEDKRRFIRYGIKGLFTVYGIKDLFTVV